MSVKDEIAELKNCVATLERRIGAIELVLGQSIVGRILQGRALQPVDVQTNFINARAGERAAVRPAPASVIDAQTMIINSRVRENIREAINSRQQGNAKMRPAAGALMIEQIFACDPSALKAKDGGPKIKELVAPVGARLRRDAGQAARNPGRDRGHDLRRAQGQARGARAQRERSFARRVVRAPIVAALRQPEHIVNAIRIGGPSPSAAKH